MFVCSLSESLEQRDEDTIKDLGLSIWHWVSLFSKRDCNKKWEETKPSPGDDDEEEKEEDGQRRVSKRCQWKGKKDEEGQRPDLES